MKIIRNAVIYNFLSSLLTGFIISQRINNISVFTEPTLIQGYHMFILLMIMIYTFILSGYLFSYSALQNFKEYKVKVSDLGQEKLMCVYLVGENNKQYIFKLNKDENRNIILIPKEQVSIWEFIR